MKPSMPLMLAGQWEAAAQAAAAPSLSPSQVSRYMECSASWFYKYKLKLPSPQNAGRALGDAIHSAVAAALKRKAEGADLPTLEGLSTLARMHARRLIGQAELADTDDPAALISQAEQLVQLWYRDVYPATMPDLVDGGSPAVELESQGTIGGIHVAGKVDYIAGGAVCELKTSSRSPAGVSNSHRFQLATYAVLEDRSKAKVVTLTKAKTPKVIEQSFDITAADRAFVERIYPTVADAIAHGHVVPNRSSLLCSRKNCDYWRQCQLDYGGEVAA